MININTKIIILAIIVLLLVGAVIFLYLNLEKNKTGNIVSPINSLPSQNQNQAGMNIAAEEEKIANQKAIAEANVAKLLPVLEANHPELSAEQLKSYSDMAVQGGMASCLGNTDKSACISSVSFLTDSYYFCGEIFEPKARVECATPVLEQKAPAEIAKCDSLTVDDNKANCLTSIFTFYTQPTDCSSFKDLTIKNICESVVYFQMASAQRNNELCAEIKDEFLKKYCVKVVI